MPSKTKPPSAFRLWALLALLAASGWATYKFLQKSDSQVENAQGVPFQTARVTTGSVRKVLRLTGSTIAKNFRSVAAPMMRGSEGGRALTLIYLAPAGAFVKRGDLVADIDAQAVKDHIDDIEAQIAQLDSNVRKRQAEQALSWETLQQNIRVLKSRVDKAKLDASVSEIRTIIDAELIKLTVEEAEATHKQAQSDLAGKKIAFASELRVIEIDKELQVRHRDRHLRDLEAFRIKAPIDGLVVMQTVRRGNEMGQVKQGDMVAPAQPFMKIVDTGSMQVQAAVSQVESEEMRMGMPVNVTFDAFPDLTLRAKVASLGAIATAGMRTNYYLRTIPVFLTILDRDDRVIPDLSTSNDVLINQTQNASLIPLAAVDTRDGKSFVRVKRGDRYETQEVKLGLSDKVHVAVLQGVREGEEVAIYRPIAASEPAGN